jgi:hypothetical protein
MRTNGNSKHVKVSKEQKYGYRTPRGPTPKTTILGRANSNLLDWTKDQPVAVMIWLRASRHPMRTSARKQGTSHCLGGRYEATTDEDRKIYVCCTTVICRVHRSVKLLQLPVVTSVQQIQLSVQTSCLVKTPDNIVLHIN